jgi:hypothetical protein
MFNPMLITGMIIVNGALIVYSIAIFFEIRLRKAATKVVAFFTAGVILDITSTAFMIIGSRHIPITPHGFLGYSALAAMLAEAVILWRYRLKNGTEAKLTGKLHVYSVLAYSWWVIAYIAGGLLAVLNRAS